MSTRRTFLAQAGRVGGYGATYVLMQSLGLLPIPSTKASTLNLPEMSGKGKKVVILGAGIAGMVAAWELSKASYSCVVLEARERAGGRNWTVRNGTRVEMTDGTTQTCAFDESLYFDAGPARLPSQHLTMLGYCKEFGVPLEVEVNSSRSSLMQSDLLNGGKPVEQRQMINDTRGHVAELLAKAIDRNALDQEFSKDDKERMLEFLRIYGDLSPDKFYKGSPRSGYKTQPGAGEKVGEVREPLDMRALLSADLWDRVLYEENFGMQSTMFQPVGGMDRIAAAFQKRLEHTIRFNCPVEQIRKTPKGVRVTYRNRATGAVDTVEADFCICALPFSILKDLDTDLSEDVKQIISSARHDSAYKIAWESRRFWEQEFSIYGGLSFLKQPVNLVWYPSSGLLSNKGVLVAGYAVENGTRFEKLDRAGKLEASRNSVEILHPGYSKELSKPLYVSWGHILYSLGGWMRHRRAQGFRGPFSGYERVIQADGPIYLAGDHLSHMVAWQEGAALSAHHAVSLLAQSSETR